MDNLTPTKKRKVVEDPDSGGAQNSNVEIEEQLDDDEQDGENVDLNNHGAVPPEWYVKEVEHMK